MYTESKIETARSTKEWGGDGKFWRARAEEDEEEEDRLKLAEIIDSRFSAPTFTSRICGLKLHHNFNVLNNIPEKLCCMGLN